MDFKQSRKSFNLKINYMKRLFVFALAATTFAACNDQKNTDTTTVNTDSTTTVTTDVTTTTTYVPGEGDVIYRDGKVMVWRNGVYVITDKDVTQDDGIVIKTNGTATRNGVVVKLEEGGAVTKTGRFFNSVGEAIEDGWDATKKGVNKAGQAIKKGANKVGEEVKDAVN